MTVAVDHNFRPPVRDWSRVLPLKDAAGRVGMSDDAMLILCKRELVFREQAFFDHPSEGGKPQWFVHKSHDPRLADATAIDRMKDSDLSGFSAKQRSTAFARRHCVLRLIELERTSPNLTAAALHQRVLDYAAATFPALKISSASLYRWRRLYRDPCDLVKLLDARGGDRKSAGSAEAWAEFRVLFLTDHRPSVRDVWKSVGRIAASKNWEWCSYKSVRYQLNKRISPQEQTKHRDPARYRSSLAPYIQLDPESFAPGKLWIGDHKQLDLVCRFQEGNVRPWLTAWMDWRTRKVVGWVLSVQPNSSTILAALRAGILDANNRGGPDEVWIDNGKDYAGWVFHGTTKHERRVECKVDEPTACGVFDGIGIKAHFAQPYNPNGKARLERWFRQIGNFSKRFATYTGEGIDTRPESLAAVLKDGADVPSFEEVLRRVGDFITGENEDAEHGITDLAENGFTLAPSEAFRRWCTSERRAVDRHALDLFLHRWAKDVTVTRNGIRIAIRGGNVTYGQFDATLRHYKAATKKDRTPLRVAYDDADLREISVYTHDWKFLCRVGMNGVGGRSENPITAQHVTKANRDKRRYDRARSDVNNLAITQILTNEEQIGIAANPPAKPTPATSIRPVRTPLDGVSKDVQRYQLRKAAGAESQTPDADSQALDLLQPFASPARLRPTPAAEETSFDLLANMTEQNHEW